MVQESRAGFHVAEWRVFCHTERLRDHPARLKLVLSDSTFQGVPDNLMILVQNSSHTKLITKGRLIFPSEKILTFKNGQYIENTQVGIELQDEAPLQAQILRLLETYGALRVSELAKHLQRSDPQISAACSKLQDKNKIVRKDRTKPYQLA